MGASVGMSGFPQKLVTQDARRQQPGLFAQKLGFVSGVIFQRLNLYQATSNDHGAALSRMGGSATSVLITDKMPKGPRGDSHSVCPKPAQRQRYISLV
jgi:hypothetical protein